MKNSQEIYFDWGNALYRQATALITGSLGPGVSMETSHEEIFHMLIGAADKYEAAYYVKNGTPKRVLLRLTNFDRFCGGSSKLGYSFRMGLYDQKK